MPYIVITCALVIVAIIGGGISAAATHALPGDPLWNFKTTVNEEVESMVALSDTNKTDIAIARAKNRIDEARTLAQQGKLDADTQSLLTEHFDDHVREVSSDIVTLQAKGEQGNAATLATKFQTMLADQVESIIDTNAKSGVAVETSLAPILVKVRNTLYMASSLSSVTNAKDATTTK